MKSEQDYSVTKMETEISSVTCKQKQATTKTTLKAKHSGNESW